MAATLEEEDSGRRVRSTEDVSGANRKSLLPETACFGGDLSDSSNQPRLCASEAVN